VAGKRLLCRPLTGTPAAPPPDGIAYATKADVTPPGEKFWRTLWRLSAAAEGFTAEKGAKI
jgi:hypothetical protein